MFHVLFTDGLEADPTSLLDLTCIYILVHKLIYHILYRYTMARAFAGVMQPRFERAKERFRSMEEQQSLRPTWYDPAHVGYSSSPSTLPAPMGLGIPAWAESLPEQAGP